MWWFVTASVGDSHRPLGTMFHVSSARPYYCTASTGTYSGIPAICCGLSPRRTLPRPRNSRQCLIHVCFPSGPLRALKWIQFPTSLPQEHGKDSPQVYLSMDLLTYPSLCCYKPLFHWFPTSWLLAPYPNSTWSLCWDVDTSLWPWPWALSLLFQAQAGPLRSISVGIASLTFPVTLLFLNSWE